jgi:hypothetical protein
MYEFLENVGPFDDNEPLNEYVIIFQHFILKLMKGFSIQLGRKRTDMEQMSMREHPISNVTG